MSDVYTLEHNRHLCGGGKNLMATLAATDHKDQSCVCGEDTDYVVRRLTPTECARLQGFPDWWCSSLADPNPTEEEVNKWCDIWNEWNAINGKPPKSRTAVKSWLTDPYSDSAEYKMWGNGIALPCAEFVLFGLQKQGCKTLGSLFDGSGGFPLAGLNNGITPLWSSEIEPFPIRVTERRLPSVKHYGDVSKLNGSDLAPVDIITYGSPCQNLSLAGKRAGIHGERSGLFFQAIRIISEMKQATNGKYPRYAVWENVMGAFSSNKGDDFREVLQSLCRVKDTTVSIPRPDKWLNAGSILGDGFSICWRVLNAQYWGVPQRRNRIYLVADFTNTSAEQVLFECESLYRYSPKSRKQGQDPATCSGESTQTASKLILNDQGGEQMDVTDNFASTLRAQTHGHEPLIFENHSADSRVKLAEDNIVPTVTNSFGTGGNNVHLVGEVKVYGISSKESNAMNSDNPNSGIYEADTSRTINCDGGNPTCNQGGMCIVSIEGNGKRPSHGKGFSEDNVSYTLNSSEYHGVAYGIDRAAFNQGQNAKFDFEIKENVEPTITAKGPAAVAHRATPDTPPHKHNDL